MKIYYQQKLKQYSRNLRNSSTLSEVLLWNKLKGRQMMGYQFMRQKPINNYIVDFFCSKVRLVLEVDGSSHLHKVAYDVKRQCELESLGLNVIRIDDLEVKQDINNVLRTIRFYLEEFESKSGRAHGCDNPLAPFGKGEGLGAGTENTQRNLNLNTEI